MGKAMRWLNPRSDGTNARDNAPATDPAPVSGGNSDSCCVCTREATCSSGGDRYCGSCCPHPNH